MNLLSSAWGWVSKKRNQATLAFIGGGLVVAMGGAWEAYLHFSKKPKESLTVTASGGGIAAGGNVSNPTSTGGESPCCGSGAQFVGSGPRPKILETGYSLLKDIGGEEPGYGLYSYAIVVNDNDRSAIFLRDVIGGIPRVEDTAPPPSQTNIFYIPVKTVAAEETLKELNLKRDNRSAFIAAYVKDFYDYRIARALLDHLCDSPAKEINAMCEGDLSRGPFIFAYAQPASKVTPVPPPFLFIDLSNVHERAFPEFIAAFRAQVKREDISDRAKIDTLRLKVLSIALEAADWVVPAQKAVADIVHSAAGGQFEKDKK